MRSLSLLFCLVGCSVADAEVLRDRDLQERASGDVPFDELSQVDARGAAQSMAIVRKDIEALPRARRAEAAAALHALVQDCGYTRASMQLPLVLQPQIAALDPEHMGPFVRADLALLQQGLTDHVATLDLLEVTLPMPHRGDFLYERPGMVDRAGLADLEDPLGSTGVLVEGFSNDFDDASLERVRRNTDAVGAATGHNWALTPQLRGWLHTLRRIEPWVIDARSRAQVNEMIGLLELYSGRGC
jgi:hypothetical protein